MSSHFNAYYAGRRYINGDSYVDVLVPESNREEQLCYPVGRKGFKLLIGQLYKITNTPDTPNSIRTPKAEDGLDVWVSEQTMQSWTAMDASCRALHGMKTRQEKLYKEQLNNWKVPLAPIRKAYISTDRMGKRAIQLMLLEYLERG